MPDESKRSRLIQALVLFQSECVARVSNPTAPSMGAELLADILLGDDGDEVATSAAD